MWEAATFESAGASEPISRAGYVYRGLGLFISMEASPKGRRPPRWCLVHLNSGHGACYLTGHVAAVFPIAAEIAEAADWCFDGIDGWRNADPELPRKVRAFRDRHPKVVDVRGGSGNADVARAILTGRAA